MLAQSIVDGGKKKTPTSNLVNSKPTNNFTDGLLLLGLVVQFNNNTKRKYGCCHRRLCHSLLGLI